MNWIDGYNKYMPSKGGGILLIKGNEDLAIREEFTKDLDHTFEVEVKFYVLNHNLSYYHIDKGYTLDKAHIYDIEAACCTDGSHDDIIERLELSNYNIKNFIYPEDWVYTITSIDDWIDVGDIKQAQDEE